MRKAPMVVFISSSRLTLIRRKEDRNSWILEWDLQSTQACQNPKITNHIMKKSKMAAALNTDYTN